MTKVAHFKEKTKSQTRQSDEGFLKKSFIFAFLSFFLKPTSIISQVKMTQIRQATRADIPQLLRVYDAAQDYMISSGNSTQWGKEYPTMEQVESDIQAGVSHVVMQDGEIVGAFCAICGIDPTYAIIEDGTWVNDELPYTTLHRIASDGRLQGIFHLVLTWCEKRWSNLRADTHQNNRTMIHLLEKHGFQRCGVIYVRNHSPRIAYQRIGNL